MTQLTKGLNASQKKAVLHNDGPLLVLAGAGSGKTRVLTHRIARLVAEKRCRPSEILAVTFTNKAAREMQERIAKLVSKKAAEEMTIATFHSFGARILREYGEHIGLHKNFSIIDDTQRKSTLREIMRSSRGGGKQSKTENDEFAVRISLAKNASLDPESFAKENPSDRKLNRIYKAYHTRLLKTQSVDFDDLLLLPLRLFQDHPAVLDDCRNKYQYVSIDEFQDTNGVQMKLAKLLAATHRNIMVVGDDDQGIYSWRGAEIENIISFPRRFKGCTTIILDVNYRSTQQILEAAHAVVSRNQKRRKKQIRAAAGEGEQILTYRADDEIEEAEWIARAIQENVRREISGYNGHALLFRTNVMMRRFEEELRRQQIPYQVIGATSFFERREIKDVFAYLRFFSNKQDELSLMRVLKVPNKGVTPTIIEKLEDLAGLRRMSLYDAMERHTSIEKMSDLQHAAVADFVAFVHKYDAGFRKGELSTTLRTMLSECGYLEHLRRASKEDDKPEARLENVEEIIRGLEIYEKRKKSKASLTGYVQELSLTLGDNGREDANSRRGVALMTLHKSKGLEFPIVFLCNLDDATIPSPKAIVEGGIEEERRLFYVGMTRAQRRLYLTWPKTKVVRKRTVEVAHCRFLNEIPVEFLDAAIGEKEDKELEEFSAGFFDQMRKKFGD